MTATTMRLQFLCVHELNRICKRSHWSVRTHCCIVIRAEIEGLLGTSLTKLFEDSPSQQRSIPVAAKAGGFKLQQRTLHVFAEAQRVKEFQKVCNHAQLSQEDKLKQLEDYMDASQTSCRY